MLQNIKKQVKSPLQLNAFAQTFHSRTTIKLFIFAQMTKK